ncbi:TIGR03545 family protein [Pseudidiomarina planktonica]|uniref:TIGR03545 family protein n=1 Tax=Pseudidiomarina planktonica TaxID=1323738 RepID=A0A1Y6FX73_9GAMM|nr:TIGR03545 family protein [Pseudidiomarina planktonica]RUO63369.1 TIGR03545 family protein [Pseudidiomarina planktonica]SMQ80403.1 TIGR03545 family protein [Pseudidiomarina planktonica]
MTKQLRQSTIRWPGVGAFFIIIGLLVGFSFLLLDTIIKWTLESSLGTLNRAEVNIASVEHGWVPLSLTVSGVQVTDPAQPENNRVVVGELRGDLDLGELLVGRVIFDQVNATGIRVNQPRQSPGEVYTKLSKDEVSKAAGERWEALKMELPSMDEVMAQVELQTDTVIERAKSNLDEQKQQLKQTREALPSSEQLAEYETKVKELLEGDIESATELAERREQLEELKAKFRADRDSVKAFKTQVETAKNVVQSDISALRKAPEEDLAKIKSFMSFDATGLENITALIFGEQIRSWSKYVLLAYEQLAPMMQRADDTAEEGPLRSEGVWFTFMEANAPPEFLVRNAVTEFAFGETILDVNWQNITHQHTQLGQPTTFQARADNSAIWDSFNLTGEMALKDNGFDARQQWQLKGAKLNDIGLSDRAEFMATMAATLLDSEGSVAVRNGLLDGDASVRLAELKINASGDSRWAELLSQALGKLNRLDIRTEIGGELTAPTLSLNSDLDRQLGDALRSTATDAAQTKLAKLQQDLTAQVNAVIAEQSPELAGLVDLEGLASSKDAKLEDLLKSQLEDKLKDKLKDRLLKKIGGG